VYVELTGRGIGEDLKAVKEQLRAVPARGLGYGVLRYLGRQDRRVFVKTPETAFNYLGQLDANTAVGDGWQATEELMASNRSAKQRRPNLLAVNGDVTCGCLRLSWEYSKAMHQSTTITQLAESCTGELRAIIAHCRSVKSRHTPSDFPLADLSSSDLEELIDEFDASDERLPFESASTKESSCESHLDNPPGIQTEHLNSGA